MYNVITPWPPQRNGIADYTYALAQYSSRPLTVITQALRPLPCGEMVQVLRDTELESERRLAKGPNLFHIGNNPDHLFAVPQFLRHPGIAVIHDVTAHYLAELVDDVIPGFISAQLAAEHPKIAGRIERLWQRMGSKRTVDYREIKMLGWLRDASQLIVHSQYAARAIAPYFPGMPVHVVPHFAYASGQSVAKREERRAAARQRLGLSLRDFVMVSAGFVTANKQYDAILTALAQLPAGLRARVRYVIAGEVRPEEYDLHQDIARLELQDHVSVLGFVDETSLEQLLVAADLTLNLRYPTFGESSGSVGRALGLGCAVAVSDAGSYAELPDEVCLKIPARPNPISEIVELITQSIGGAKELERIRAAALDYARTELSPARAAARYDEIVFGGGTS